jgi:hypothetical protein
MKCKLSGTVASTFDHDLPFIPLRYTYLAGCMSRFLFNREDGSNTFSERPVNSTTYHHIPEDTALRI